MRAAVWGVGGVVALVLVPVIALAVLWRGSPEPVNARGWTLLAEMPDRRGEVAGALAGALFSEDGEEFVVVGGLTGAGRTSQAVRAYDPEVDAWRARQSLPAARHHAAATALDDGTLMVAGGSEHARNWAPEADVWLQDGDGWRRGPAMPEGRWGHQMVTVDGVVYVIGGAGRSASTLIYDDGSWRTGAPLPESRDHLGVAVVDGEIWAIGGRNGAVTSRVDIYDPQADAWRNGPALPSPTSGAAVASVKGLPVVVGGEDPEVPGGGVIEEAWYYDGRSWQTLPRPPLAVHGAAVAVIGDRLVIAGGASRHGAMSILAWVATVQTLDPNELPSR
ncbi:MAG TPA: hypothetical protein VM324_12415 [Egibacteraceae bacterium]|nr:hypothetical protein [Egibacteraceae bacterium]